MKRLALVVCVAVFPAMAADFAARVAAAKKVEATADGAKYAASLVPHIGEAIQSCIPPGSTDSASLGAFSFIADVTADGIAHNIAAQPRTKVSACFGERFSQVRLPQPPAGAVGGDYPIFIEMRVTP
jgi:hypothetical protein